MAISAADRTSILDACVAAFQGGCAQAVGADGYKLGTGCEQAVRDHYGTIVDKPGNSDDLNSNFKAKTGAWKDAEQVVRDTGVKAVQLARAGSRQTPVTVSTQNFTDAASATQEAKLASTGSRWC